VHDKLDRDTAGTAGQRDIPYHMTPSSAIKAGGRRRKVGHAAFVFPSIHYA